MEKSKLKISLYPIIIALFFVCFIAIQAIGNVYLLIAYVVFGAIGFNIYFTLVYKNEKNAKRLFLIIMFFWFQEFSSAQENRILRYFVYVVEVILLLMIALYAIEHMKKVNKVAVQITAVTFIALVFVNFVGTLVTYKNLFIFLYSTYDSCKYFALIFYILAIQPTRDDFKTLLKLLSVVVIINTTIAIFQFAGVTFLFDVFRGRYKIVTRVGSYRAIGIFPYGIELGNYSSVLFALFYNFSKIDSKKEQKRIVFIELCLAICIIVSGTRTAMVNILVIYILSNIKYIKGWIRSALIVLVAMIISSNVIDFSQVISRTKWDISIELPRTYYFKKGIDIWEDHPLFGIGFNTYGSTKYRQRTNDIIFDKYDAHKFDYANLATTDSFVAEFIPEFGFLGIAVIIFYGLYIFNCYKRKTVSKDFNKMFLFSIISISIMSINTSTPFINSHIGGWFWISCGMLICTKKMESN
jgi:hypothetical protein